MKKHGWIRRSIVPVLTTLVVFVAMQSWQTKDMPKGVATQFSAVELKSGQSKSFPSADGRVEILYFFAPWCGVCKLSSKNAERVVAWLPRVHLTFVGLDYDLPEEVSAFVADNHLTSSVVLGNSQIQSEWRISGYPSTAIINSRGEISSWSIGYSTVVGTVIRVLLAQIGV